MTLSLLTLHLEENMREGEQMVTSSSLYWTEVKNEQHKQRNRNDQHTFYPAKNLLVSRGGRDMTFAAPTLSQLIPVHTSYSCCSELEFLNILWGARNRVRIELSYRPAGLQRMAELIPWNRFLGSINFYKFGLCTHRVTDTISSGSEWSQSQDSVGFRSRTATGAAN